MVVRLRLVGEPRFSIDDRDLSFQPRVAAECFAVIASRGSAGISREEIAPLLWGQLEPANARAQLRQALTALRNQLDAAGFLAIADFGQVRLRLEAEVQTDIEIARPLPNLQRAQALLGPICDGWSADRWRSYADEVAAELAVIIPELPPMAQRETLRQAVVFHPESPVLAQHWINLLATANRLEEANEALLNFENAWIDRFGLIGLPTLSIPSVPIPSTSVLVEAERREPAVPRPRVKSLVFGTIGTLAVAGLWAIATARNAGTQLLGSSEVEIESVERISASLGGEPVIQTVVGIRKSEVIEHRLLSDQTAYFIVKGEQGVLLKPIEQLQKGRYRLELTQLEDRLGPQQLLYDRKGKGPLRLQTFSTDQLDASEDWVIPPTVEYPNFDYHRLLGQDELVFSRECDHPERCHKRLFHGVEGKLYDLSEQLGYPRIALFTARVGTKLYGKYSFGKSDGWRYHAFSYEPESRSVKKLSLPPVIGESKSGHRFCLPESTTVRNGSHDTRWNGTVLIIDPAGRQKLLKIGGQSKFYGAYWLGDGLAVACSDAPFEKEIKVVDPNGYVHVELTKGAEGTVFHSGVFLDPGCFLSQKQGTIRILVRSQGPQL